MSDGSGTCFLRASSPSQYSEHTTVLERLLLLILPGVLERVTHVEQIENSTCEMPDFVYDSHTGFPHMFYHNYVIYLIRGPRSAMNMNFTCR